VDRRTTVLLDRFAAADDGIADETAQSGMREVLAFEGMNDPRQQEERPHL
jgi:hypothetical protein